MSLHDLMGSDRLRCILNITMLLFASILMIVGIVDLICHSIINAGAVTSTIGGFLIVTNFAMGIITVKYKQMIYLIVGMFILMLPLELTSMILCFANVQPNYYNYTTNNNMIVLGTFNLLVMLVQAFIAMTTLSGDVWRTVGLSFYKPFGINQGWPNADDQLYGKKSDVPLLLPPIEQQLLAAKTGSTPVLGVFNDQHPYPKQDYKI
ncbi:uncharacterized protein LOC128959962 [Oppia nitens]|uniref:uncharacterized protein LOC128959962 n=1 Tax=Oppia nitens TaxID=1686743 RepID=UPI0023DA60C2|nr:uncharacterized protein LOC128959962 [Oppia nitens]